MFDHLNVLTIENLRTDNRIAFVGGIRGVKELVKLVDSGKFKIAFSMSPVTVDQLLSVADASQVMPQVQVAIQEYMKENIKQVGTESETNSAPKK